MSPEIPFIVNGKKKKSGKNKNAECPFSLVICKEIELQCPVTATRRLYRDREKKTEQLKKRIKARRRNKGVNEDKYRIF